MPATPEQLAGLNRLLALLPGQYRAKVDAIEPDCIIIQYGAAPATYDAHLSLYESPEGWSVFDTVTSGGDRWSPPDVDVCEVHPPAPWPRACRNIIASLFSDILADAVGDVMYEEPVGGLDPSTPEGWDNSTGKE